MSKVAAVVVLFNAEPTELLSLLEVMLPQLAELYLVDNSEPDSACARSCAELAGCGVHYLSMGGNAGIACAQNVGIRAAIDAGCTHVLLLDQDSLPPHDLIAGLLAVEQQLLARGERVAAVGPVFFDRQVNRLSPALQAGRWRLHSRYPQPDEREPLPTAFVIASGALLPVAALKQVGLMEEALFIDWVDVEWGQRASRMGLGSWMVPTLRMQHCIGQGAANCAGRAFNLHSDQRNYYILRNALYLCLRRRIWPIPGTLLILLLRLWVNWRGSRDRGQFLRLMGRALLDGLLARMGRQLP